MFFKQIHSMHCFFKMTCPTTSVILFSISFNTDRRHKVTYTKHFLTEILIYKSTVCKCAEHTVIMLFTKFYNIVFTNHWFSACKQISMDSEFFSLCNDAVHIFVCKIIFISVLGSPTTYTMHIACACRVHKYNPRYIAVIFFGHFLCNSVSVETGFISKSKECLFKYKRIRLFYKSSSKFCPFTVFIGKSCLKFFISFRRP